MSPLKEAVHFPRSQEAAHGARARGPCFGALSARTSGAPTEHIARGNGGMLASCLIPLMLMNGPLPLPLDELSQHDAHTDVHHRLAQLL